MAWDGEAFIRELGRVLNDHDVDGLLSMMTDDVIFEASFGKEPWGTRAVGSVTVRGQVTEMLGRVPDVRWDEIRHFVCPDHAVVEWVATGTPRGGTRFETHMVDVLTLRDAKIAAKRTYRKAQT